MSNSDLLSAALRYADLGLWIFPLRKILTLPDGSKACTCKAGGACPSIGKHPAIKWATQASCDPQVVRGWRWAAFGGIGCATGPSGLVVFDADGLAGLEHFRHLSGGVRWQTAVARTARGAHVYFSAPPGANNNIPTSSDPVTKLDVRSTGGFVVLPPSPHASGHVYSWEVAPWDAPIAECPPALLEYARAKKKRPAAGTSDRAQGVKREESKPSLGSGGPAVTLPDYLACATPDFGERLERALNVDWGDVARALQAIDPDCGYSDWFTIGMALHAAGDGSRAALEMWDAWSGKAKEKYKGVESLQEKWNSFTIREDGVGLGSLFVIAAQHGYRREVMPSEQRPHETRPPDDVRAPGAYKSFEAKELSGALESADHVNGKTVEFLEELRRPAIVWADKTDEGRPKHTCANAIAAVRAMGVACDGDRFHERYKVGGRTMQQWAGELSDELVAVVRTMMRAEYRFDPGTLCVHDALISECLANSFHPVKIYFESLQWDRVPRLSEWMVKYLGAPDDLFNRAVGRLALVAAVRRVLQPGCKFDHIIVLEGPEGRGKSTAIEILAGPENFSDQTILSLDDKGQQEAVSGVWLYEIADLAGHSRAEVEKVKAFASRTTDRARPAYGRKRVDKPRTCVFFATTNDKTYLKSQTGNRRFWPVECGRVDLEGLRRDRDQLWAEALQMEKGASLILNPALWDAASERQEARREHDPWDDRLEEAEKNAIRRWATDGKMIEARIASRTVMDITLGIAVERQSDSVFKRVAHTMRRLGWEGPTTIRDETATFKGYRRISHNQSTPVTGSHPSSENVTGKKDK